MTDLTSIIRQLEDQKAAIERALSALREVSGVTKTPRPPAKPVAEPRRTRKRRLSPEGRARIAEAARRRWAAKKEADARKGQTKSRAAEKPPTSETKRTRKEKASAGA